jgi:O-antigen ligase
MTFATRMYERHIFTRPAFSFENRLSYWKETLQVIKQHPFKGTGIGNFHLEKSQVSHNSYLQIWAELGLLTMITWMVVVIIFLKNCYSNIRKAENKIFPAALLSAGLAFLLHNIIDYSFFIPQVSFLWWIILGYDPSSFSQK